MLKVPLGKGRNWAWGMGHGIRVGETRLILSVLKSQTKVIPIQIMFATHQYILEGKAVPLPLQSVAFFFQIGIR